MKRIMFITFLVVVLAACAPVVTPASTETPIPTFTFTPITPTTTPTLEFTPFPTLPPIGMTPDPAQLERWKEYQTELAKVLLYGYGPDAYKDALCEWDILGRSNQEVYVWAYCSRGGGEGGDIPTVIHLKDDGTVQNVEVPGRGSMWDSDINKMFPSVVQEKFGMYTGNSLFYGRIKEMIAHIDYREAHPEEPPLVVLSATPIP